MNDPVELPEAPSDSQIDSALGTLSSIMKNDGNPNNIRIHAAEALLGFSLAIADRKMQQKRDEPGPTPRPL